MYIIRMIINNILSVIVLLFALSFIKEIIEMRKLSLIAFVLLAASNAKTLEEAIKDVEVEGYLRYEYEDNRFRNREFNKQGEKSGDVIHTWHAEAEFKTPTLNNIALNFGLYYDNENNVNHGKGEYDDTTEHQSGFLGNGLGAGADSGTLGVSTFYATITPNSTNTIIDAGKMRLDTPYNDNEEDRGTGIFISNADIPFLILSAGYFDSWALDDLDDDLPKMAIDKPFYTLGATFNHETSLGNFNADLWGFHIDDIMEYSFFGWFGYSHSIFLASLQYAYTKIDSEGMNDVMNAIGAFNGIPSANNLYKKYNDFLSIDVGLDFESLDVPATINLGYITNTRDNFAVGLDNEGMLQKVGAVWFDNNEATQVNFSAINGAIEKGTKKDLNVFYASATYGLLDTLTFGIDYVQGRNKVTTMGDKVNIDFYEITPNILYSLSDNTEILVYYAFLKTKRSGNYVLPDTNSERRNQFKIEAVYSF